MTIFLTEFRFDVANRLLVIFGVKSHKVAWYLKSKVSGKTTFSEEIQK